MKKLLVFSTMALLYTFQSAFADSKPTWHEARKKIITQAQEIIKLYDNSVCVWATKMRELVLAKEFETEAWEIAQRIVEEIMPQLPVYKMFIENPYDDIYLQELTLQSSMIAGQVAAQVYDNFEFGAKIGAIIGSYIDILKDSLRTK